MDGLSGRLGALQYFVMAMALFYGDTYEEVMRKLADGLDYMGTWRREWEMPSPGGLCHARQRLGAEVVREIYERVAVPCAMRSTKCAWLAGRRLMAIDGFGMEAPDSEKNACYFGYAGKERAERVSFRPDGSASRVRHARDRRRGNRERRRGQGDTNAT